MSDKNIVESFRESCLADLKTKQESLPALQQQWLTKLESDRSQKLQQLSKTLVQFQDTLLLTLRQKFKYILEVEEKRIQGQRAELEKFISERIEKQNEHLERIIKVIQGDDAGSGKMLGKIAAGKVQSQWKEFRDGVLSCGVADCGLWFDKDEVVGFVEEIGELLHTSYPITPIEVPPEPQKSKILANKSQLTQKNPSKTQKPLINTSKISNPSKISQKPQTKNPSHLSFLKNQSILSVHLELQQEKQPLDSQAIEEFKETKTVRKMKKLEQKIMYREISPQRDVEYLVRLALERKRLLKQLE